jgi:alpha-D-xyloside xylohydrolase
VPIGPCFHNATKKPEELIEIRIYQGSTDSFELYEDENDTYNYEGLYSTILFNWNDAKKQLTIGKREGTFPGMTEKRPFSIVIVKQNREMVFR